MSLKNLVDATMKHGTVALTETAGGETNAYAPSWWTKNIGYVSEARKGDTWVNQHGERQPYNDKQIDQANALDRSRGGDQYDADYYTGGHDRKAAEKHIAQQDAKHLSKRDPAEIEMKFDFDEAGGDDFDDLPPYGDPRLGGGSDDDIDWDERTEPELDRQTNYDAPSRYDGDDSYDFDESGGQYYDDAGTDITPDYYDPNAWAKDEVAGWDSSGKKGQPGTERGRAYRKEGEKLKKAHDRKLARSQKESIRVNHPIHGNGIVEAINQSYIKITWDNLDKRMSAPNTIPFSEAKYLTRLKEEYTDDVADAQVGNAKTNLKRVKKGIGKDMKKKNQKVDESMVAVGMAAIGGTHRGTTQTSYDDDDIIRFDDLLEDGDEWKKPWTEDEGESEDGDDGESEDGGERSSDDDGDEGEDEGEFEDGDDGESDEDSDDAEDGDDGDHGFDDDGDEGFGDDDGIDGDGDMDDDEPGEDEEGEDIDDDEPDEDEDMGEDEPEPEDDTGFEEDGGEEGEEPVDD